MRPKRSAVLVLAAAMATRFHKDFTEYARKLKERNFISLTPPKGENGENHG
jgi:hypothetical protein